MKTLPWKRVASSDTFRSYFTKGSGVDALSAADFFYDTHPVRPSEWGGSLSTFANLVKPFSIKYGWKRITSYAQVNSKNASMLSGASSVTAENWFYRSANGSYSSASEITLQTASEVYALDGESQSSAALEASSREVFRLTAGFNGAGENFAFVLVVNPLSGISVASSQATGIPRTVFQSSGSFSSNVYATSVSTVKVYLSPSSTSYVVSLITGQAHLIIPAPGSVTFSALGFTVSSKVVNPSTGTVSATASLSGELQSRTTMEGYASSTAAFSAIAKTIVKTSGSASPSSSSQLGSALVVFQARGNTVSTATTTVTALSIFKRTALTTSTLSFSAVSRSVFKRTGSVQSTSFFLAYPVSAIKAAVTTCTFSSNIQGQTLILRYASATVAPTSSMLLQAAVVLRSSDGVFSSLAQTVLLGGLKVASARATVSGLLSWYSLATRFLAQIPSITFLNDRSVEASTEDTSVVSILEEKITRCNGREAVTNTLVSEKTTEVRVITPMASYKIGQVVQLQASFTFEGKYLKAEQLGSLGIRVQRPNGTTFEVNSGITEFPDNSFRYNLSTVGFMEGNYRYYWFGDGEYASIGESSFSLKSVGF